MKFGPWKKDIPIAMVLFSKYKLPHYVRRKHVLFGVCVSVWRRCEGFRQATKRSSSMAGLIGLKVGPIQLYERIIYLI